MYSLLCFVYTHPNEHNHKSSRLKESNGRCFECVKMQSALLFPQLLSYHLMAEENLFYKAWLGDVLDVPSAFTCSLQYTRNTVVINISRNTFADIQIRLKLFPCFSLYRKMGKQHLVSFIYPSAYIRKERNLVLFVQ